MKRDPNCYPRVGPSRQPASQPACATTPCQAECVPIGSLRLSEAENAIHTNTPVPPLPMLPKLRTRSKNRNLRRKKTQTDSCPCCCSKRIKIRAEQTICYCIKFILFRVLSGTRPRGKPGKKRGGM